MKVIILAAGYGTRLYPLTINLPKPLIQVNGTPIINFLVDKLKALNKYHKITELRIVSNNKFYNNFLVWNKKYKVNATIINDGTNSPQDRLGAVKDIRYAIGQTKSDWLVLGGDNLFEDDLRSFVSQSLKFKPDTSIGVYDIKDKAKASHYGVVKVSLDKTVAAFTEKPKQPKSTLVASCVYFFPKESVNHLDDFIATHDKPDASGAYIQWLVKVSKVKAHVLCGRWFDIGHLESLKQAELELKKKKNCPCSI